MFGAEFDVVKSVVLTIGVVQLDPNGLEGTGTAAHSNAPKHLSIYRSQLGHQFHGAVSRGEVVWVCVGVGVCGCVWV